MSEQVVVPGDSVLIEAGGLMGKGLMQDPHTGEYFSTICGTVDRINKLVFIKPLKRKYVGDIGDVVVGRIIEVAGDRWVVDYGGVQTATLPLGGVNLPGSVQRRRTEEDKQQMRDLFQEGDVFVCEIQKIMETGDIIVHCRSNKYGILRNGLMVQVESSLIRRQAMHFVSVPVANGTSSVNIILGNNGWIWIGLPSKQTGHIQSLNFTQMDSKCETVDPKLRLSISKVRNCIVALADAYMEINVESISVLLSEIGKANEVFVSEEALRTAQEIIFSSNRGTGMVLE